MYKDASANKCQHNESSFSLSSCIYEACVVYLYFALVNMQMDNILTFMTYCNSDINSYFLQGKDFHRMCINYDITKAKSD